jgi:D-sedoheptulose 7-phosphate isomerase
MSNQQSADMERIVSGYLDGFARLLRGFDVDAIGRIIQHLLVARRKGATIFVAGNGGSAATASHWVNDLGKATKRSGRAPMRAMSLSDNVSWLTALANDEGYESVFAGQLENFAQPGDVLVVISASGNSPNLVRAVELAKSRGATTIAFVGFDGGVLKDMVHDYFWFPTSKGAYGLVESGHALLCHILTTCLAEIGDGAQGVGSYAPTVGTQLLQNKESFGRGA